MNQLQMARQSAAASVIRRQGLKRTARFCGQQALLSHQLAVARPFVSSFSCSGRDTCSSSFHSRTSSSKEEIGPLVRAWNNTARNNLGRWVSTTSTASADQQDFMDDNIDSDDYEDGEDFDPNNEEHVAKRRVVKRQRAMRRVATQSIPTWLKRVPFCFEHTVEALNLNLSSSRWTTGESFIAMSDLPGQYRKAFVDSIPSFVSWLQTSDSLPADVEQAIDRLVEAGFSDAEFAKNFRTMRSNQLLHAQTTAVLQENIKKYEKRQAIVQEICEVISELEIDVEVLATEIKEYENTIEKHPKGEKNDGEGGSFNSLISLVTAAARLSTQKTAADEAEMAKKEAERGYTVAKQKMIRLQKQIEGRKQHVESHERGSLNVMASIENLTSQQQELHSSMTREEFDKTQLVVNEALLVLCDALADHIQQRHSKMIGQYQDLDSKTDLTTPHEWYSMARLDKRKVIYHGGPTNSGKTYSALQRLKTAKRGLYVGPLRLLAGEIYETLNAQGVYTSLITGQERREFPFSTHVAATVEMAANLLDEEFEVVVIDEIQMIEDKERGFAWTRALLGLRCKEIHVCGGLEAKGLIEKIASACGDDFELNTYERFSDLTVARKSLAAHPGETGSFKWVRKGDCVVAFSRNDIFSIKREIERDTSYKCCVIYGTLPPATRTTQAQLFNDPNSGFDVLIASDAISMGLNLNIRRIVFNSIFKNDGNKIVRLGHSAVKQIAGRAGRRNSPFPEGEVTCRDPRDLDYIQECLGTEIKSVEKAGLIFTASHVDMFGEALQSYYYSGDDDNEIGESETKTPHLHTLLQEFSDMAVVKGDYFLCRQESMYIVSKWLKDLDLETSDKYTFCMAPISVQNPKAKAIMIKYGQKLAAGEVAGLPRGAPMKRARTFYDLALLCSIYSEVELFIWLQNKFPPINLMEQQTALARKDRASLLISLGLDEAEKLKLDHCHIERDGKLRMVWAQEQEKAADDLLEAESEDGDDEDGEETVRRYV